MARGKVVSDFKIKATIDQSSTILTKTPVCDRTNVPRGDSSVYRSTAMSPSEVSIKTACKTTCEKTQLGHALPGDVLLTMAI